MTKVRHIVKELTLNEISGVNIPAQSGALVTIMKSAVDVEHVETIAKYLSSMDGTKSFNDYMADGAKCAAQWEAQEAVYPALSALQSSVNSIVADLTLSDDSKQSGIRDSVTQFLTAMQSPQTDVTSEVIKVFTINHEDSMSEELKKAAEDLKSQVAELAKKLANAEAISKLSDAEKAHLASLEGDAADKFKAASPEDRKTSMKKVADADEVFKSYTGTEIHKSSVGPGVFELLKAQDAEIVSSKERIAKAEDHARTVELTKKADDELKNFGGETRAKVSVLKAMDSMTAEARETLTTMLKAGNSALSGAFVEHGSASASVNLEKSAKIETLAKAYQDNHPGTSIDIAKVAVLRANPELYEG